MYSLIGVPVVPVVVDAPRHNQTACRPDYREDSAHEWGRAHHPGA